MRIFFLISSILLFNFQQSESKLNGKYRVVTNQNEEQYVITFNDSVYKKLFRNGKEINGKVKYGNLISLADYKYLKVTGKEGFEIQTDELKEDELITLKKIGKGKYSFCFSKNLKEGPINWLDICIISGEMVKAD
ncbi:MAG: hypothetical protein KGZ81_07725 [Flavobacteriales bacterium]|jgi:hypothetical protein|nr:hypothetical protein [Flavobacteriales bacterium]